MWAVVKIFHFIMEKRRKKNRLMLQSVNVHATSTEGP